MKGKILMLNRFDLKNKLLSLNLFIDNKFLDSYLDIIYKKNLSEHAKGITQKHHIIPQCYFKHEGIDVDNSQNNIIYLNYCDHVLAHKYLIYCTNN